MKVKGLTTGLIVNRIVIAIFAVVLIGASVVALHEIFFAVPACPDGSAACTMRDAHFTGSRLVGAILMSGWVFLGLWVVLTRRQEVRAAVGALPLFWVVPLLLVGWLLS